MYDSMGVNIEFLFDSLCTCVDAIKQLKVYVSKGATDYHAELLLTMLEIRAFTITIQLDISTFLRADFRAKHPCEKRICLKYVNVAVLEGCKYMQGSGKDAKHGKLSALVCYFPFSDQLFCDYCLMVNLREPFLSSRQETFHIALRG